MKVSFYGVLSATLLFFLYIYKKTITWHDLEKVASAQEGNGYGGGVWELEPVISSSRDYNE